MGTVTARAREAQSPKAGKLQYNRPYAEVRSREHLFPDEVEALIRAAKKVARHPHRDATIILLIFRHGLRVSELVSLRWEQVNLKGDHIHVNRLKRVVLQEPQLNRRRLLERSNLRSDSEYLMNKRDLSYDISFINSPNLSFTDHIHGLEPS